MTHQRLYINIDHVATLRQARRVSYPDPVMAARVCEDAGADGITAHLREDRRHIQDADVVALASQARTPFNLEMACTEEMTRLAERLRPHQVTLVPERREEVTTEGGLDLPQRGTAVERAASTLTDAGISVSLFLDPDPHQVEAAAGMIQVIDGFEINTDRYTRAEAQEAASELARIVECARLGASAGLAVYAGHGLSTRNVSAVAAIPEIEELNIGHALISRAVFVGLDAAIRELLAAIG